MNEGCNSAASSQILALKQVPFPVSGGFQAMMKRNARGIHCLPSPLIEPAVLGSCPRAAHRPERVEDRLLLADGTLISGPQSFTLKSQEDRGPAELFPFQNYLQDQRKEPARTEKGRPYPLRLCT